MALSDGKSYNLASWLNGSVTLVIPDMQRDYAWGARAQTLVSGIVALYHQNQESSFGFIHGYEYPEGSDQIMVVDGHQRLTTLYLLLGMLYRRVPSPALRNLLISEYQLIDNQRPRLVYQSRQEAMYFLSDLITKFFLDRDGRLSQIENSEWFFNSYLADVNVVNFLAAIRGIDVALETAAAKYKDWDFEVFTNFVANNLMLSYCDLGDRTSAESAFLTINTTCQPLSMSQKLRAYAIANSEKENIMAVAEKCDRIEDWFWKHREYADLESTIAFWQRNFSSDEESSSDFMQFFKYFSKTIETLQDTSDIKYLLDCSTLIYDFVLTPTIRFVMRFGLHTDTKHIRRFFHLLCNLMRYQRPTANGNDLDAAEKLVIMMQSPDILSLLDAKRLPERIINSEEYAKLKFIAANAKRRDEAENCLCEAEAQPLLNGRVADVIKWTLKDKSATPLDSFRRYVDAIEQLWGNDIEANEDLDLMRRALLGLRTDAYPMVRRGETVLSFCWHSYDWQRLYATSPWLIKRIIDLSQTHSLEDIAQHGYSRDCPLCLFIKCPELLKNCRKRQVLCPDDDTIGFFDLALQRNRWFAHQKEI